MREAIAILRMNIRAGTFEWSMVSDFLIGMGRLFLYNTHPFLLRGSTRKRFETRKEKVNPECLAETYCTNCGCHTEGMLMTKQGCKIKCYE